MDYFDYGIFIGKRCGILRNHIRMFLIICNNRREQNVYLFTKYYVHMSTILYVFLKLQSGNFFILSFWLKCFVDQPKLRLLFNLLSTETSKSISSLVL